MSYTIDDKRRQTMLKRIGQAADLIDDKRFLPFYRGVQIKLEKLGKADEWERIIETAKSKSNPSRYFAKLCRMVRDGTYQFAEKVKEVAGNLKGLISDRLERYNFKKEYHAYWVKKAAQYINRNSMAGFIELLEYAERKGISQRYLAAALKNGMTPSAYYKIEVIGGK